jgi:trimethylamine--corrinoid protein Co-methyltransferase
VFRNEQQRFEVLAPESLEVLDRGWKRILTEVGIEFLLPESLDVFRAAGQKVVERTVFLDPEFVLEQIARAPSEFAVQARNPARSLHVGGDSMVFSAVYGPPFVREGTVRRDATFDDYQRLIRLVQGADALDTPGGVICEPNDLPLDSRHLQMVQALQTLSDKPYFGSVITGEAARDSIRMTEILFGSRESIETTPAMFAIVNVNSPLLYDDRMLEALHAYAAAGQPVIITPFLLMGAMAPVSVPAAIAQQTAEAFAGIALAQLIRPGTPILLGSFLSTVNMQSGSPTFGGPESAVGLYATGQIARRYGLPWRAGGGGLTSSQTVDAQAAYEAFNTMLPAFLAGANLVMHAAGWLESGLVSSFEKFVLDLEILQTLIAEFTPLVVDEESLAFGAHQEVGHGGHFLGAEHTLARFRDCFYRPFLSSSENEDRWRRLGARDTAARASEIWPRLLEAYEQPPLDPAIADELDQYVTRRKRELGD